MGKLKIVGVAEKEYRYDLMEIKIDFRSRAMNTKDATKKVSRQYEDFLSVIAKKGIPLECIRIGENTIEANRYDERHEVCAEKEMIIKTELNIPLINYVMETISEKDYSADFKTDYSFSDEETIENELLREAIEDSKTRAAFIAETTGKKITGIKSVNITGSKENHILDKFINSMRLSDEDYDLDDYVFSNKLDAPVKKKTSCAEVIWILE